MQFDHQVLAELYQSILNFDMEEAKLKTEEAIRVGCDPLSCINDVVTPAIKEMGRRFQQGEIYLPELVMAADAMIASIDLIRPVLEERHIQRPMLGKVVIGTVQGDIHDIGKNIVASMLIASGFEVIDLGVDVKSDQFIAKAMEVGADVIAMSSLMSVTMPYQRELVRDLTDMNLRDKFMILVGGGPITQAWADSIGADGYAENAQAAPGETLKLIKSRQKTRN